MARPGAFAALAAAAEGPAAALLAALAGEGVLWRSSYGAGEAGAYGRSGAWTALASREGPVRLARGLATVMVAGPGVAYPAHRHGPAELYLVLSGGMRAEAEGRAARRLGPGEAVRHAPRQAHAMRAGPEGAAVLAVWDGDWERSEMVEAVG